MWEVLVNSGCSNGGQVSEDGRCLFDSSPISRISPILGIMPGDGQAGKERPGTHVV